MNKEQNYQQDKDLTNRRIEEQVEGQPDPGSERIQADNDEAGHLFKQLDPAPLRAGFREELRGSLQMTARKETVEKQVAKSSSKTAGQKSGSVWQSWFNGGRGGKLVACLLVLLFCGGILFWSMGKFLPTSPTVLAGTFEIKALDEDKLGVETNSGFVLISQDPLAEKTVKENLQIEPAFEYTLDKRSGGKEYRIIPKAKLAANTVYRLAFDPQGIGREQYSWAFQTKGEFRIVRTLPGERTTHVPIATGIEITFSHDNFSVEKAQEYFLISPQVKGIFEKHQRTLVFVPEKQLEAESLYTVTVKKGLPLTDSDSTLSNDYTFSFETASAGKDEASFSFELNRDAVEFGTADAPIFPLFMYSAQRAPATVSATAVTVYRFPDSQSFVNALREREQIPQWTSLLWQNYHQDFSSLSKAAEYQLDLVSVDSYSHYLVLPEKLAGGYYAAEIKIQDCVRQVWFQVTDLAVYFAQGPKKTLLWVNNLQTKKPTPDPELRFIGGNGKGSKRGNKQGVIMLEEELGAGEKQYALVKSGANEIVVPLFTAYSAYNGWRDANEQDVFQDYWKYFYLERELFKPDDTVHFWGIMSPRKGAEKITELEIELKGTGRNYSWRVEESPLLSQKVSVDGHIFSGAIELPTLAPGYYYLQVRKGNTVLLSRGFTIEIYQKPAYKISVQPEKKAIFSGEKVNFLAKAAFFEGTPVSQVKLNYSIWDQNGQVTTDADGTAKIPYTGKIDDDYTSYHNLYLGVTAAMPEAGDIGTSSEILVFSGKVLLEGTVKVKDDQFTLNTSLCGIDLARVNAGAYPFREYYVGEPAVGQKIKGEIYQEVWTKEKSGQKYNFITKKVEETYSYRYSTRKLDEFTLVTDPEGKAVHQGTFDPEQSYFAELSACDEDGRVVKKKVYIYRGAYHGSEDYKYHELCPDEGKESFSEGEQVSLKMLENGKQLSGKEQGYLFYRGQKEIETYELSNQPQYSFVYPHSDLPNINVGAIYFDGAHYYEALPQVIPFNREQKALRIEVSTDQEEYRPKDVVKLSVKVTDQQNKPVKASINLNLVDEAIYSMREQRVDLLTNLYQDYVILFLNTRASHEYPQFGGGAERGGEGDSERKDFVDTVLFTTVETDSRGEAGTEFVLPDNLTSWRLTYHALTADLKAGSGTSQIAVRLPFFVEMVMNEQYLAGDAPIVVIRSFGEKVQAQEAVSYKMELRDSTGKTMNSKVGQGIVAQAIDWQLPSLQEGVYTLTVEGKSGAYRDKLSQKITVVSSLLERTKMSHQLLAKNTTLEGSKKGPTLVVFSDYEKSQYLRGLSRLAGGFGSRLEQKLAAREANKLLAEYHARDQGFSDDLNSVLSKNEATENLQTYQQADGGIAILPYGKSEPALTALVASLGSPGFDDGAMAGYFYELLDTGQEKGEDLTLALWGLGALCEPVLLNIQDCLAQEDLAPTQKVHLALAMSDIGNGVVARQIYGELLKTYGEDLGNTYRIKIGQTQDEIVAATAEIAMLAAKIDAPEKNKFYQYLLENPGQELLTNLAQLQVLQYQLRYLDSAPVSFTLEKGGKKEAITLKGSKLYLMWVLPEELAQIKFSELNGKIGVVSVYSEPYGRTEIAARNDLEITRSFMVNGRTATTLQRGDLVEVVLQYGVKDLAPGGQYEIVDVLPAGLKYVSKPYQRTAHLSVDYRYPSEVKGQKVSFSVVKTKGKTAKIVYYARVVSPGEFTAQGTLLSQVNNREICILGSENRIVIK